MLWNSWARRNCNWRSPNLGDAIGDSVVTPDSFFNFVTNIILVWKDHTFQDSADMVGSWVLSSRGDLVLIMSEICQKGQSLVIYRLHLLFLFHFFLHAADHGLFADTVARLLFPVKHFLVSLLQYAQQFVVIFLIVHLSPRLSLFIRNIFYPCTVFLLPALKSSSVFNHSAFNFIEKR